MRGVAKAPRVKDFLLSGEGLEGAATFLSVMSQASSDVNTLYLFDLRGEQLITRTQGKEGKHSNLADRAYVQAALAGKEGFSSAAVSYTHLDVYKRQRHACAMMPPHPSLPPPRRLPCFLSPARCPKVPCPLSA